MSAAFDASTLSPPVETLVRTLAPAYESARGDLVRYAAALARFGAHTDLVGAKTPEALAEIALADALVLARDPALCASPGWEIGAGGASLSVPLALLLPAFTGRLVEPRQKRATFLRLAIGTLGLAPRLTIDQGRVDPARPPRDIAGCAFGRAVFAPDVWIPLAAAVVRPGGAFAVLTTGSLVVPPGYDRVAEDRYTLPFARVERVTTWLRAAAPR
ncbi:MAG: RsmG family class I SAM-dependent methyltransferase [Deltaproteobacteria bacterium]